MKIIMITSSLFQPYVTTEYIINKWVFFGTLLCLSLFSRFEKTIKLDDFNQMSTLKFRLVLTGNKVNVVMCCQALVFSFFSLSTEDL